MLRLVLRRPISGLEKPDYALIARLEAENDARYEREMAAIMPPNPIIHKDLTRYFGPDKIIRTSGPTILRTNYEVVANPPTFERTVQALKVHCLVNTDPTKSIIEEMWKQ